MAEGKPLSTKDLFLLMVGWNRLKKPDDKAKKAEDHWLDNGALRESEWNHEWPFSPKAAWESVRYRDWLAANIAANLTGRNQDFVAISEPVFVSLDLLPSEIKPGMPNASEAIKQIVSNSGYERSFLNTLSIGLSKRKSSGKDGKEKDVFVLGAGMRRRARVWVSGTNETSAMQADVEFFVPFYIFPGPDHSPDDSFPDARAMCAGIAITRANGGSIGVYRTEKEKEENKPGKEYAAMRFNFRLPFTASVKRYEPQLTPTTVQMPWEPPEFKMVFGTPEIEVQKRDFGSKTPDWEKFDNWKAFVKDFCELPDAGALLNAPIGPLLLEKVSNNSGIKDIIRQRDELEEEKEETIKALEDAYELLKGLMDEKVPEENPDPDNVSPNPGQRRLGHLLESLGFLKSKPSGPNFEYSLKSIGDVTVVQVFNRLIDELDGFPLYVKGQDPDDADGMRGALTLASQAAPTNTLKHYFGLAGLAYNITLKKAGESIKAQADEGEKKGDKPGGEPEGKKDAGEKKGDKEAEESNVEIKLHLGKWFDGETLDDNWYRRLLPIVELSEGNPWKRRVPLPGIRLLPLVREQKDDNTLDKYSLTLRADLLSLGFDIKGTSKDGLLFFKDKGVFTYFHLGGIETRLAFLFSGDRFVFGIGVKLKDVRLSLAPEEKKDGKKKDDKGTGDEILDGLKGLLDDDDWAVVAEPEKPKERTMKTRMGGKKKDKFSLSVGYLTPMFDGSHGTLDVQLYDDKGVRGKTIWIPIEGRYGIVYAKHIGIGLKGVENIELSKPLGDGAQITFAITGGLRCSFFELGFINAKITFQLNDARQIQFGIDGLDVSLKLGPVIISGSFLRSGFEFAGSLTLDVPKLSIGLMGYYGSIVVLTESFEDAVVSDLKQGKLHDDLRKELLENEITPAAENTISKGPLPGQWELRDENNKRYAIIDVDGELNVLSPEKTFFAYGVVNAATGGGINIGPLRITGIAFGGGYNRRIKTPPIEKVAEFPLVQMVMGKGGIPEEPTSLDIRDNVGTANDDPASVLSDMADYLVAEQGQTFFCGGVRFSIYETVDCFALIIVQYGNDFELALLGLARFRQPRDLSAKPLCYVEMQILMSLNPKDGYFKLQALLTSNSWILNKDCKLTGGFALFVWFDGPHKGDFVITLGGYHPRFQKPDHYPTVPRIGINWPVSKELSIKGGGYLAFTPSCCMIGSRLEATFHSDRVSVWFTAYLDAIIAWSPFHFEVDIGISLRIEAALFLFTLKVTISATLQMWGPPVGGIARIDLTLISFDVPIGTPRDQAKTELIETWAQFSRNFLNASEADKKAIEKPPDKTADKPVDVSPIMEPSLPEGRNNLNKLPPARKEKADPLATPRGETAPPAPKGENGIWKVRGDELELAASASIPVTKLNVGCVNTSIPPEGVQERSLSGKSLLVAKPVVLDTAKLRTKNSGSGLGVHPMGKSLESVLNVTIVRDDVSKISPVDLSDWTIEEEKGSLPAALWDAAKPEPRGPSEPSAKLISNCITGIKRLKPPAGKRGRRVDFSVTSWTTLDEARVPKSTESQKERPATRSRDVQAAMVDKQEGQERIAGVLASVGFNLAWQPSEEEIRFRQLQAEPLAGAVAKSA